MSKKNEVSELKEIIVGLRRQLELQAENFVEQEEILVGLRRQLELQTGKLLEQEDGIRILNTAVKQDASIREKLMEENARLLKSTKGLLKDLDACATEMEEATRRAKLAQERADLAAVKRSHQELVVNRLIVLIRNSGWDTGGEEAEKILQECMGREVG